MATKKNTTAKNENRNSRNTSSAVKNKSSKADTTQNRREKEATAYILTRPMYEHGKIRCFKTKTGNLYKVFILCENFEGWDKYQFSQLFTDPGKALKYAFILKKKTNEKIQFESFCFLMEEKKNFITADAK